MNVNQLLTEVWQYFARHFVTGLVVFLFLIFLPSLIFNGLASGLLDHQIIVVLLSLIVGLFLNSSKAHRLAWCLLRVDAACDRKELRMEVLRNFKIQVDQEEYKKEPYKNNVQILGEQIIDLFVTLYQPELFSKLQNRRNEVDVTLISLASVGVFGIVGLFVGSIAFLNHIFSCVGQLDFINPDNQYVLLIWYLLSPFLLYFVFCGSKNLHKRVRTLNKLTGLIVFSSLEHQAKINKAIVDEFFRKLLSEGLIQDDGSGYSVRTK